MRTAQAYLVSYLLSSFWQVPLFFGAASVAVRVLRDRSALCLHRIWVGALLLEVAFPLLTGYGAAFPGRVLQMLRALPMQHGGKYGIVTVTLGPASVLRAIPFTETMLRFVVLGYGLLLAFSVVRLAWGLKKTMDLRHDVRAPQLSSATAAIWRTCQEHFQAPETALAVCPRVQTPLTLGWRRPYVLLPDGLLEKMSPGETRTLFAHECAHVQRRDFWLNLLYETISLPIVYHPFWRLTRERLVESREWVCDANAARATGAPGTYARSLLRLATLLVGLPAHASHAIGVFDANAVERRLMQLTRNHPQISPVRRFAAAAACSLLAFTTCASAWALRTSVVPRQEQSAPAANGTSKVPGGVMAGYTDARVNPVYPPDAKAARIQGSVVMQAIISREGAIEKLEVVSGPKELRASALDAVRQWTYKPYVLNGAPVAVETTITVNYQLHD